MDDDPEIEEKTETADVGGLKDEGVDILSGRAAQEEVKLGEEIKVKEEMAAYLREFDTPEQNTKKAQEQEGSTKTPAPETDKKLFSSPSPFVTKTPAPEKKQTFIAPPPEGVKSGVLSNLGDKVLGGGPKTPKPKPVEMDIEGKVVIEKPVGEIAKINASDIKPLRTYKTDAEEAIRYKNMSVISMHTAETKKVETKPIPIEPEKPKKPIPWITILVSTILVVGGGGALYFTYVKKQSEVYVPIEINKEKTLVRIDDSIDYTPEGNPIVGFASTTVSVSAPKRGVVRTRPVIQKNNSVVPATPEEFFNNSGMPNRVIRVLGSDMLLGVYGADQANQPFMIFKTLYFENTFAGMLEWEKTMDRSLAPLIQITHTNTGTTSPKTLWSDKIVSNKDTRILQDQNGVLLIYSILDKDTVLITTSIESFIEIVNRYTEARVTR